MQSFHFYYASFRPDFTECNAQKLNQILKAFSSLRELDLGFISYDHLSTEDIFSTLVQGLKTHRVLQSLGMYLTHSVAPQELKKLGKYVGRRLPFLGNLRLYFNSHGITSQGLEELAKKIKELDFLHGLSWDESAFPQFQIKKFNDSTRLHSFRFAIAKGDPNDPPLQELAWDLKGCDLSQNKSFKLNSWKQTFNLAGLGLRDFNQTLEQTQSFQSLKIKFHLCNQICEEEFWRFGENLKKLSSLTRLELDFSYSAISILNVYCLSEVLKEIKSLKQIVLSFKQKQLESHNRFVAVPALDSDHNDDGINNEKIDILSEGLKSVKSLETVDLSFYS